MGFASLYPSYARHDSNFGYVALSAPIVSGGPHAEERRQEETEVQELRRQGHPQEGRQGREVPALRRDRDQAMTGARGRRAVRSRTDRSIFRPNRRPPI